MYKKVVSCQACLSNDRKLQPIKDLKLLYDAINDLQLSSVYGGLCWECVTIIKKYTQLRKKTAQAQWVLGSLSYKGTFIPLSSLSKQSIFKFESNPLVENSTQIEVLHSEKQIKKEQNFYVYKEESNTNNGYNDENDYEDTTEDYHEIKQDSEIQPVTIIEPVIKAEAENLVVVETASDSDDDTPLTNIKNGRVKTTMVDKEKAAGKYDCVALTEEELVKLRQRKADQPNYVTIKYKCETCILGFLKEEALYLHMEKKHDPSKGEFRCDICDVRFVHSYHLSNHRERHFKSYRCKLCQYAASEISKMTNHCLMKHVEDTEEEIHCHYCVSVFSSQKELDEHIGTKHRLICECGIKFKDRSNLRNHKRRIHGMKRRIVCDYCKQTFKSKYRLEAHITKHNAELAKKLSYCAICKIQYKNIYIYRSHLKNTAKHVQDGWTCSVCNKTFASKVYWKKHYDFFHLKKSEFKCEQCNKIFISYWRLKNHNQTQHGEERPKNHSCNICGKNFFTTTTLRAHKLTHSEQRSYMCSECGDTFKQRPALYNHTRLVHKGYTRNTKNDG